MLQLTSVSRWRARAWPIPESQLVTSTALPEDDTCRTHTLVTSCPSSLLLTYPSLLSQYYSLILLSCLIIIHLSLSPTSLLLICHPLLPHYYSHILSCPIITHLSSSPTSLLYTYSIFTSYPDGTLTTSDRKVNEDVPLLLFVSPRHLDRY